MDTLYRFSVDYCKLSFQKTPQTQGLIIIISTNVPLPYKLLTIALGPTAYIYWGYNGMNILKIFMLYTYTYTEDTTGWIY